MPRGKIDRFFFAGQQIEKQGRQPRLAKAARNELIARTEAAASRAVHKQHDTATLVTYMHLTFEHDRARGDARLERIAVTGFCHRIPHRETSAPG